MRSASKILNAARTAAFVGLLGLTGNIFARQSPPPVTMGADGTLQYVADERGNRVPDFSSAGYRGGGVALPDVPVRVQVTPADGDDGARIQAAIDYVAGLPADAEGRRGAVQLTAGRFEIAGALHIAASGVVLRGAGQDENGTVLVATGTGRRTLIEIAGTSFEPKAKGTGKVLDDYVPVGATRVRVTGADNFKVGDTVEVERPSPAAWIEEVGMHEAPARQPYQWRPDTMNMIWHRRIVAKDGATLEFDAPLTTALEARYGGATVATFADEGYLAECGVENLRCESEFDATNPLDEQHAWNAIALRAARDAWVSDVTAVGFAGSAVQVAATAARVTVQDCASLAPVSELGGYRRLAFHARGEQVLLLRCRSEAGRNDFTVGYLAAGPNVFLDCVTRETHGFSGSLGSWASGVLFDTVTIDGGALRLDNLETFNQGVGWAAANSVIWGSSAGVIVNRRPPGANNWAVGVWAQFVGDGTWSQVNEFVRPASLYRAQLRERLGDDALAALAPRRYPAVATEAQLEAVVSGFGARLGGAERSTANLAATTLRLRDGVLTIGDRPLHGKQAEVAWWRGRLEPARADEIGPALTRFAPGRSGTGLTDEIAAVAERLAQRGEVLLRQHYGLWYDRRRDDHQMIRRPDAEVWPPFFEQPFARSGRGRAWDGLSRYDLTRYNPWYFERLRAFAGEARRRGLVLLNEMYFQHNIIESGAHWVDSPWRPVNNINDTGFTEPPPFTGDTIKMATEFYDVNHPVRRALHRAYIRQCLSNLADEPHVIHTLSAENSGPRHFMEFWLDVVAEWERETGRRPLIALSAPKDVQDAVLADPQRAAIVDVIDLTYWFRTDSGREFAPNGGQSLAPRQHLRLWKGGRPSAASIAAMAREYRERFPGKAVISGLPEADDVQPGLAP